MYALIVNNQVSEYPCSYARLRNLHLQTSFPKELSVNIQQEFGLVSVIETELPTFDGDTHRVIEGTPELVEGQWRQTWEIVALPAEQVTENQLRHANEESIAQARAQAKADVFVQQFVNMTPAQVATYVANNVLNLADAKGLLTKLALMMLAIAKEQYK